MQKMDTKLHYVYQYQKSKRFIIIIIIHAFIKRRNPTCRSKALNNDVTKVTCKANSNYVKIH